MLTSPKQRKIAILTAVIMVFTIFAAFPLLENKGDVYGATKKGTINSGPLNVRRGPSTSTEKLGTINKGKSITITATTKDKSGNSWYKFAYTSKKSGYVYAKYVTVKKTSTSSTTYTTAKKATIKDGPLTVRTGPGTNYGKLGTIAKGKTVSLKGEKKDSKGSKWYRITYNSKSGYISSSYVIVAKTPTSSTTAVNKKAKIKNGPLNVRSGAGTNYGKLGTIAKGKTIKVTTKTKNNKGEYWYKFKYSGAKYGYVLSSYVTFDTGTSDFEEYLTSQGFPSSYKKELRKLHEDHPKWVFKAQNTGISWDYVIAKESRVGNNLVEPSSPYSWKSKAKGAYNSSTKKYTKFDGRWNSASKNVIEYYMDPRNFLSESYVYQFLSHKYNSKYQNQSTIKSIVSKSPCFMNTSSYIKYLNNAGKASKVNPNVIAAMVIMEQGWRGGSGLISGKTSGYKGIYNHFNIGAYTTNSMSSTQRGLWWAKGAGKGDKSYGRPWNTIEKSLSGGAKFYAENYLSNDQYTYYTKKFNVMNGSSKVATHEYMTNVSGAASEGKLASYAYENNDNYAIAFYIPVYKQMPSSKCSRP
ncbi:MAG: SH3 domain-containing protein [Anaerovoracaceae bacterium]